MPLAPGSAARTSTTTGSWNCAPGGPRTTLAAAVGMDELHRDEAATLLDSIAREEPAVISASASAITERAIRERLGDEFVVWLDPPIR